MNSRHTSGRDALIAAAIKVAAAEGLRGLTYRAVAREAGVNNTLVAHHFGSRAALLEEALSWSVSQSADGTHLADFGSDPENFSARLLDAVAADPDIHAFQYEMLLESRRRPELHQAVESLYNRYTDIVRNALEHAAPALAEAATARGLFAAIDGMVLQYLCGLPREQAEAAIAAIWHLVAAQDTTTEQNLQQQRA